MTLSWSMDKLGPITRSVEDTALVLDAIHGADGGLDISAVDRPFAWPYRGEVRGLRVGFVHRDDRPDDAREDLKVLRELGVTLVPITLPTSIPAGAISLMLSVEAAAAFDDLTRRHVTEGLNTWPASFREKQFVSAVEYLPRGAGPDAPDAGHGRRHEDRRPLRRRQRPDDHQPDRHPTSVFPFGFSDNNGRTAPGSLTMTGQLYGESTLIAVASAFQRAVGDHLKRPPIDRFLAEEAEREAKEKEAREKEAKDKEAKDKDKESKDK